MQSISKFITVLKSKYISRGINMMDITDNPPDQFEKRIEEAMKKKMSVLNAMHHANVWKNGRPSGRMMLLRGFEERGFYLSPMQVELWQGRAHRLHDRILYRLEKDNCWNIQRLYP